MAKSLEWATTTFVPDGEADRYQGNEVHNNAPAREVMETHGIPTDDLFEVTRAFPPEMFICPGNENFPAKEV